MGFQKEANGWSVGILPPRLTRRTWATSNSQAGCPAEGNAAAREVKQDGRYRQSFEVPSLATLETCKTADRPASLSTFYRWQSPLWKAGTIAVR